MTKHIIEVDSKNFVVENYSIKENEFSPVFLIGFPRSGTTLLDTILRSHPEIDVIEEKPLINSVEQIIKSKLKYSLDDDLDTISYLVHPYSLLISTYNHSLDGKK